MTEDQALPDWLARLEREIEREDTEDALKTDEGPRAEIVTFDGFSSVAVVGRRAPGPR